MVKKLLITSLLSGAGLWAQGLSLTIGPPIAAEITQKTKFFAMFAVRVNGCAELSKAQVTAVGHTAAEIAHKVVNSIPQPTSTPGVYLIGRQWLPGDKWVVAVAATCGNETAGAVVPVADSGFIRERTQMLPHAPTQAEIDTALKAQ